MHMGQIKLLSKLQDWQKVLFVFSPFFFFFFSVHAPWKLVKPGAEPRTRPSKVKRLNAGRMTFNRKIYPTTFFPQLKCRGKLFKTQKAPLRWLKGLSTAKPCQVCYSKTTDQNLYTSTISESVISFKKKDEGGGKRNDGWTVTVKRSARKTSGIFQALRTILVFHAVRWV